MWYSLKIIAMKNICLNIKRVFVVVVLSIMVLDVSAQVLRTGYFLDGNLFRHRLNPALRGQRGYFSLPVLGGLNINAMGNVGLSNFNRAPTVRSEFMLRECPNERSAKFLVRIFTSLKE